MGDPQARRHRPRLSAPKERLKAQRWLVRNVFEKLPVHQAAHGFLPERSIVSNAALHAGADVVVKVDLLDFFPSVTFARVKGLLRSAGLPEAVAIYRAAVHRAAARDGEVPQPHAVGGHRPAGLPQGAPTSPSITNALCRKLDRRLSGLGRTFGFTYTRYADDLTFSWRRPLTIRAPRRPSACCCAASARWSRARAPHPPEEDRRDASRQDSA
ncbi:MAG: reverse transcriptase family protein [Myxococcota bacterium]